MSFNFPNSPTPGQLYTPVGGYQYIYLDGVWRVVEAPQSVGTAQSRNRIVNPCFQISQENLSVAGGATGYYPADQWAGSFTTGAVLSQQRVQSVTPNGSVNRLRITVTTADTSVTAGDVYSIEQGIEGIRIADFRYGTASARQVVARFGFRGPAGTYSFALRNGAGDRAYPVNFTVSAGQANTDTEQVFVIPGDTAGVWPADTTKAMSFFIVLQCGTTRQGTANAWNALSALGTAANTNGMGTNGNIFEIWDCGLYLDPLATGIAPPWTMPDEAEELAACQRYYQPLMMQLGGYGPGNMNMLGLVAFPVTMRTVPALSIITDGTASNIASAVFDFATVNNCRANATQVATASHCYVTNRTGKANARM